MLSSEQLLDLGLRPGAREELRGASEELNIALGVLRRLVVDHFNVVLRVTNNVSGRGSRETLEQLRAKRGWEVTHLGGVALADISFAEALQQFDALPHHADVKLALHEPPFPGLNPEELQRAEESAVRIPPEPTTHATADELLHLLRKPEGRRHWRLPVTLGKLPAKSTVSFFHPHWRLESLGGLLEFPRTLHELDLRDNLLCAVESELSRFDQLVSLRLGETRPPPAAARRPPRPPSTSTFPPPPHHPHLRPPRAAPRPGGNRIEKLQLHYMPHLRVLGLGRNRLGALPELSGLPALVGARSRKACAAGGGP
jgi:hypothetical protein